MRFEPSGSADIVREMVKPLGAPLTMDILDMNETLLRAFVSERGCLSSKQLDQINNQTSKSRPCRFVEGTAYLAKTAEDRKFVDDARQMQDKTDDNTTRWLLRSFRRQRNARALRQAV